VTEEDFAKAAKDCEQMDKYNKARKSRKKALRKAKPGASQIQSCLPPPNIAQHRKSHLTFYALRSWATTNRNWRLWAIWAIDPVGVTWVRCTEWYNEARSSTTVLH